MHYVRRTPHGICSFCVIMINNIVRVFGILITKTSKILFFYQRKNNDYQSLFVINKRKVWIAIC